LRTMAKKKKKNDILLPCSRKLAKKPRTLGQVGEKMETNDVALNEGKIKN